MSTFFSPSLASPRGPSLGSQAFGSQAIENFFFGHVGDFFTLHIDDAAAIAGKHGHICAPSASPGR